MSSTFTGSVAIASSTNASPIQITTQTAHNYATGQAVTIDGHLINTAANGDWASITVIDAYNFTLTGSTGNGVGAATGKTYTNPSSITIPSDGDDSNAASVDAAFEGIENGLAFALMRLGYGGKGYRVLDAQFASTSATIGPTNAPVASQTWTLNSYGNPYNFPGLTGLALQPNDKVVSFAFLPFSSSLADTYYAKLQRGLNGGALADFPNGPVVASFINQSSAAGRWGQTLMAIETLSTQVSEYQLGLVGAPVGSGSFSLLNYYFAICVFLRPN